MGWFCHPGAALFVKPGSSYEASRTRMLRKRNQIFVVEFLRNCASIGVTISVAGDGRLWAGPKELLSDEIRATITDYKLELLEELR